MATYTLRSMIQRYKSPNGFSLKEMFKLLEYSADGIRPQTDEDFVTALYLDDDVGVLKWMLQHPNDILDKLVKIQDTIRKSTNACVRCIT
jgi:hypothetical protein